MVHKVKILGLALGAVFALTSMFAASASAAGVLTSDGTNVKIDATEANATLTAFGQSVTCHAVYDIGEVNQTPHGLIHVGGTSVSTLTVKPTYSNCIAHSPSGTFPVTVTTRNCDFVLHIGNAIEAGKYSGTADVVCENAGESIEVHVYSNSTHGSTICTVNIPAQTGLGGGFVKNVAGEKLELGGPVTGITAVRSGILCGGHGTTTEAVQDISVTAEGTNAEGGSTGISISG